MQKEIINLKESKDEYMGGFEGRKGKGEMYYNLKNKIKSKL